MENNQKNWMRLLGVVILVAILVFVSRWYSNSHKPVEFPRQMAKAGELVAGFPKELLFSYSKVKSSYLVDYGNSGVKQYTTEYISKESYGIIYMRYLQYMKINGYYISNQRLATDKAVLYGIKADKVINMLVTPLSKNSASVLVSYSTGLKNK